MAIEQDFPDISDTFEPYKRKSHESYMNEDQLKHFKEILVQWRDRLMMDVERTVHHMQDDAAQLPDPMDRATQEEGFNIELRTRDRERKLIIKINRALELIDKKAYGYCQTCGVEIGIGRLEARPTAMQCVSCRSIREIKERQLHG